MAHSERHAQERLGWLRAAVLGANDGLVSTASLMLGVAAADQGTSATMAAGVAGLVAGAMSMAAGEFVSVSSQRDAEDADIAKETRELAETPAAELAELVGIWKRRGLEDALAREVADALTAHDPLAAHLRDELGITEATRARPWQAAWVSALSFSVGALVPIVVTLVTPAAATAPVVVGTTTLALAGSGWASATLGGAPGRLGALRVAAGGVLSMGLTWAIGTAIGVALT